MFRFLVYLFFLCIGCAAQLWAQTNEAVHFKVVLVDSNLNLKPVPRHALVINARPASGEPRRVVTTAEGTCELSLPPGNYIAESERTVNFQGKSYRWSLPFEVKPAAELTLELSVDNAVIESAPTGASSSADLPMLFREWQDSVVTIWSDTGHGTGFLIDRKGLFATNQHVVGRAEEVQVQLNETTKVSGRVIFANPTKDVAVVWVNPEVVGQVRPVTLGYSTNGRAPAVEGQQVFTIGSPLNQRKIMTSGIVSRIEQHAIISDVNINHGNSGGPLFTTDGQVIGITTFGDFTTQGGPGISGIVRMDDARDVIAEALAKVANAQPPSKALLPVEPSRPYPLEALKETVMSRKFKEKDYTLRVADFDVSFVTPVLSYGLQYQAEQANLQERVKRTKKAGAIQGTIQPFQDFKNWAEYVGELQPVLMIRATPKLVEGFWSGLNRGLAAAQGYNAGPANLHFKADFYKMRVFCGSEEVMPIHPFKIEHRVAVSNTSVNVNDATYEGLYIFDPGALGPHCGTVKLMLFTEKEPNKAATAVVDGKSLQQVWQDFAPFRAAGS